MALDAYGDIIYSGVGIWNYHGMSKSAMEHRNRKWAIYKMEVLYGN